MHYATLGGGKRIRAMLCHAAGALHAAPLMVLDDLGAAIEMIHACTLVHDDLPAMDNDVLRRGKPTVHVQFGEATAILVGDALQTQAFLTLMEVDVASRYRVILARELARAIGATGAAGGQMIDLAHVGQSMSLPQLVQMHRMKTGAVIRAAVRMGALCSVPDDQGHAALYESLDRYGFAVGLSFQVVDDILDVTTDSPALGKTTGKDAQAGKPTCVSVMGLEDARRFAMRLHQDALAALQPLGPPAMQLAELASFAVNRIS